MAVLWTSLIPVSFTIIGVPVLVSPVVDLRSPPLVFKIGDLQEFNSNQGYPILVTREEPEPKRFLFIFEEAEPRPPKWTVPFLVVDSITLHSRGASSSESSVHHRSTRDLHRETRPSLHSGGTVGSPLEILYKVSYNILCLITLLTLLSSILLHYRRE